ncbi:MAG TPA: chemotaxis protein CheB [Acidobacteriota bacterium]|jgi:two-component system chemotaxis response regulator CheB
MSLTKTSHTCGTYDVVAFASSAGGLHALRTVLSQLPGDFPAAVVLVQHLDPRHPSMMADILGRGSPLSVREAREGDQLIQSQVYIAPPNRHLLVNPGGGLTLSESALVNFVRPSADLLFESVASSYKNRAIAVVLSGAGSDGGMGVRAIHRMGGIVIVQDEKTSQFFGMPGTAIGTGAANFVLPLETIAPTLVRLVTGKVS